MAGADHMVRPYDRGENALELAEILGYRSIIDILNTTTVTAVEAAAAINETEPLDLDSWVNVDHHDKHDKRPDLQYG